MAVSLMDRCDEVGQWYARQGPTAFLDPRCRLFRHCPASGHRDKAGNRLAMTSDCRALTASHPIKQARKVGLGLVSADCLHEFRPISNQSDRQPKIWREFKILSTCHRADVCWGDHQEANPPRLNERSRPLLSARLHRSPRQAEHPERPGVGVGRARACRPRLSSARAGGDFGLDHLKAIHRHLFQDV